MFAAAAALIVAAGGGGTTAYLLSHHRHVRASAGPAVTQTITVPPSQTGIPVVQTPAPSVSASTTAVTPASTPASAAPSRSGTPPPPSPSPTASPGSLTASQTFVRLQQSPLGGPYTGTFTLTALGGPVTYSISVSSTEQVYLTLSPLTGTLQAGTSQLVTASLTPNPNGPRPAYSNPLTIEPGGIIVTVDYPPSG